MNQQPTSRSRVKTRSSQLNPRPPIGSASLLQCSLDRRPGHTREHRLPSRHRLAVCRAERAKHDLRSQSKTFRSCPPPFLLFVRAKRRAIHEELENGSRQKRQDQQTFHSREFRMNPRKGSSPLAKAIPLPSYRFSIGHLKKNSAREVWQTTLHRRGIQGWMRRYSKRGRWSSCK